MLIRQAARTWDQAVRPPSGGMNSSSSSSSSGVVVGESRSELSDRSASWAVVSFVSLVLRCDDDGAGGGGGDGAEATFSMSTFMMSVICLAHPV